MSARGVCRGDGHGGAFVAKALELTMPHLKTEAQSASDPGGGAGMGGRGRCAAGSSRDADSVICIYSTASRPRSSF